MSRQRVGKYACLEIERRYLLRELPAGLTVRSPHVRITDHYIPRTRLRLRRMVDSRGGAVTRKLAQKFHADGSGPLETTITNLYLDEPEYEALRALGGREITKDRYAYPWRGRMYHIDVFHGPLEGLILAEIECETKEEMSSLPPPDFAAADVTAEEQFTGGNLATLTSDGLLLLLDDRPGAG
jgi:CYTH domain-containing protein